MKKAMPVVLLVTLGAMSYFAYTVVDASKITTYKMEVDSLKEVVAAKDKAIADAVASGKAERERVRDALIILYPKEKEVIQRAFVEVTQPTTQPTTQPVAN